MEISGRELSVKVRKQIKRELKLLFAQNIFPRIAILTLGHEGTWEAFVKQKVKLARMLDIKAQVIAVKNQKILLKKIAELNKDKNTHGIIIQRPFKEIIDREKIVSAIDKRKDIDGFRKDSNFRSPIWLSVEFLLKHIFNLDKIENTKFKDWLKNKLITVVGRGETGGLPIIERFKRLGIKPQIIDSRTKNKPDILRKTDIVISAVGKKDLIETKNLKKGAILIGIGTHQEKGKLKGDYDEQKIKEKVSFFTPTPGGVGPLNISFLFKNLIAAAKSQNYNY